MGLLLLSNRQENGVVRPCLGGIEMARPLKLYNHAVAPNPRRVRIFAAEKGIELSLEEVDILAGQSRTPEFLAKNSSGGVPVLELDNGSYLSESVAICRYLEGLHPEPNLLRRDLREQAEIERWNRWLRAGEDEVRSARNARVPPGGRRSPRRCRSRGDTR